MLLKEGGRNTDVHHVDLPGPCRGPGRREPEFRPYEGCGGRRSDSLTQGLAGIGIEAGGQIDGQDGGGKVIDAPGKFKGGAFHLPIQPGSEHGIDHQNRLLGQLEVLARPVFMRGNSSPACTFHVDRCV